jgi:hypothetical protein
MRSRHAAARLAAATHVAVGPIAKKLLAALLVPGTEPIGTAAGLTDREIRRRPRRRRLPFLARERGSNQLPVHGAFFKLFNFGVFVVGRVLGAGTGRGREGGGRSDHRSAIRAGRRGCRP